MRNKGYIYTIISLMLALVLLSVVSLYYESYSQTAEIDPTRIRTDELHYFVESVQKDTSRAMTIAGRRGAIYLVDYAVSNGRPLSDTAANLRELIENGTITAGASTKQSTYMENNTLGEWLNKTRETGNQRGFEVNITLSSLEIYPYDSWHFLEIINLTFNISDRKGIEKEAMSRYEKSDVTTYSLVSINGIEDPLYALNTHNRLKKVLGKSNQPTVDVVATGSLGSGTGGGIVFDVSGDADQNLSITNYNATHNRLVNYTIFVINVSDFDTGLTAPAKKILNSSAGVVNYPPLLMYRRGFSYVSGIPAINLSRIGVIAIRNGAQHEIVKLSIYDDVLNELYHSSSNGSSFFDRLEGRTNTSAKYVAQASQARELLNISLEPTIGLEGFVNVSELARAGLYNLSILTNYTNQSSVDYMYFQNASGRWIYGMPEWFKLDARHMKEYNLTDYYYDPNLTTTWHLDEGSDGAAYDSSKNTNTLTISGASWTAGQRSQALYFDGSDYATDPAPTMNLPSGNKMTVTAWIKPAPTQVDLSYNGIVSWGPRGCGTDTGKSLLLSLQSSGRPSMATWCNDYVPLSGPTATVNQWNFVAVSMDGAQVTLYLNNNQWGPYTLTSAPNVNSSSVYPLNVGCTDAPGRYFNGTIDDVKIWNRALSPEEIQEEYEKLR